MNDDYTMTMTQYGLTRFFYTLPYFYSPVPHAPTKFANISVKLRMSSFKAAHMLPAAKTTIQKVAEGTLSKKTVHL